MLYRKQKKLILVASVLVLSVLLLSIVVLIQTPVGRGELNTIAYTDELFRVGVEDSDFKTTEISYDVLVDLLFENIDMGDMNVFNHVAEVNYKYVDVIEPSIVKTSQFVNVGDENNQYIVEVVGTYLVDISTNEILDCYGIWSSATSDDFVWEQNNVIDTTTYPNKETLMSIRGRVIVDCSSIFDFNKIKNLETAGFENTTIDNKNACEKFVILHVSSDVSGL